MFHRGSRYCRPAAGFVLAALFIGGCGGGEESGKQQELDSDRDGLVDTLELKIGTSPYDADTDGDGVDDAQEYALQHPDDPYTDNPLIADTAKILVSISKSPQVSVDYVTSSGKTVGESLAKGTAISKGTHESNTLGGSVSGGYSTLQGWTANFEVSGSHTWGDSEELQKSMQEVREKSQSNEISKTNGRLEVMVRVKNVGKIMARLEGITLSAVLVYPGRPGVERQIGGLNYDNTWGSFEAIDLKPHETKDGLPFIKKDINLETLEAIIDCLANGGQVKVRVATYRLIDPTDEAHRSLDRFSTAIGKRTAAVMINYGPEVRPSGKNDSYEVSDRATAEAYRVATYNPEGATLSAAALLKRLQIPFEVGTAEWPQGSFGRTKLGLLQARDYKTDAKLGGYWVVRHTHTAKNGQFETHAYNPLKESVRLDKLMLAPGHILQLDYVTDVDHDRLSDADELYWGTNPLAADTDGDGLGDGDEVEGWNITVDDQRRRVTSNPLKVDSDGDGASDKEEQAAGTDPSDFSAVSDWRIAFSRQLGTNLEDRARAIAIDKDDNIYLAGDYRPEARNHDLYVEDRGTPSFDGNSHGPFMIAKYTPTGERRWVEQYKHATGNPNWYAHHPHTIGMAVDSDGNTFTVNSQAAVSTHFAKGQGEATGRYYIGSGRWEYIVVNRFDATGKHVWQKELDSKFYDLPRGLTVDAEGGVYVAGTTRGNLGDRGEDNWGRKPIVEQYGWQEAAFLAKVSRDGKVDWTKQWMPESMGPLVSDRRGNLVMIAATNHNRFDRDLRRRITLDGKPFEQDGIARNLALIKYDASGQRIWVQQFGFDKGGAILAIATDSVGNIYIAGHTSSRLVAPNRGNEDAFLMKYDAQGNRLWVRQLGTAGTDQISGLFVRDATVYAVGTTTGVFASESGDVSEHRDVFLASYDDTGRRQSLKQFSAASDETASGIVLDSQGSVYVFGTTTGSFNEKQYENRGKSDLLLLKLTPAGSLARNMQLSEKAANP